MLKPLADKVLIKINENEKKTKNNIILLGNDTEKIRYAEVIKVGSGTEKIKMEVKEGDKVIINKDIGIEFKYQDTQLIIINQSDILAIIE